VSTRASSYGLAVVSGLLLALSFPTYGHPAIGWIALAPLLLSLHEARPRRAFTLGLTAGIVYFTGTLYWITGVMTVYGGLARPVAVLVNALLIAYLALFPALFALLMRRIMSWAGARGLAAAPLVWVAAELGRTYIMGGFPWVLLGYSQTTVLPVAQFASVLGVFGLSGLVAAVSASLAYAGLTRRFLPAVATVALVLAVAGWGSMRVARGELTAAGDPIRVGLVQGNVDQGIKWDRGEAPAIFQKYISMTRQAIGAGAELIIWPESSTPFTFEEDIQAASQIRRIAKEAQVSVLLGSDEIERDTPLRLYNSAYLVRPDGSSGDVYRKMHLVPFGEYVPLQQLLFFAGPLVEAVSDFTPGEQPVLLPVNGHPVSAAICYEIVYPGLVRSFVRGGSQLLTTITNDAWFGRSSAPEQHFEQAAMRAIENGRYLVRSANTGISGIVDPYGRVIERTDLFEPAVVVNEVRFLQGTTIYTTIGDAFAFGSLLLTIGIAVAAGRLRH
jgi:apolipoprotein N-acyltransferase